jgi:hypothetical protein
MLDFWLKVTQPATGAAARGRAQQMGESFPHLTAFVAISF